MDNALGLVEVIGYVTAIEAADAALKAANVKLMAVTKVDGGIMTVQLLGDVGAIRSAVDAGGAAAERIGEVRAVHMIPRMDPAVARMLGYILEEHPSEDFLDIVPTVIENQGTTEIIEEVEESTNEEVTIEPETTQELLEEVAIVEQIKPDTVKKFAKEELEKISNQELKKLIGEIGLKVSAKKLKGAKKDDLIQIIIQSGKEGDIGGNNR